MAAGVSPSTPPAAFRLDRRATRRAFERAAALRPEDDPLAREVERRMAERLELITYQPALILDAGSGHGTAASLLSERYPASDLVAIDAVPARLIAGRIHVLDGKSWFARARDHFGRRGTRSVAADLAQLPFAANRFGMLWSNLALNWAATAEAAFVEWHRVLEVGGLVMFSCYGPDTLVELRAACAEAAPGLRVHAFTDMHDLGDMLVAAGFGEPVMDMERITLTYQDLAGLARDLRATGQVNVLAGRARGLLGRRAWTGVAAAYERSRRDGRLPATFEIVYGHAWKSPPRVASDGRAIIRFESAVSRVTPRKD